MNTALEYSTRVVQEGGRRCKKSTLNDLVHLTPLRIPLMNPPLVHGANSIEKPTFRVRCLYSSFVQAYIPQREYPPLQKLENKAGRPEKTSKLSVHDSLWGQMKEAAGLRVGGEL